jgi:lauroyl/myristoyl acyltransferase
LSGIENAAFDTDPPMLLFIWDWFPEKCLSNLKIFRLLLYRLDRKHRSNTLDNLARAFGDEKNRRRSRIARNVFANLFLILFEIGWLVRLNPRDIPRHIQFTG